MDQTCLLIVGMHRSVTSALAGILKLLGVDLGSDLLDGTIENEKILRSMNSSRDDLFCDPSKLKKLEESFELEKTICEKFKYSNLFVIKDHRLLYLFPLYEKVLKKLKIATKIIISYRNPFEVVPSRKKRDAFSLEKRMLLWAYSLIIAEKYSRDYPHVFVSFDDLLNDTEKTFEEICNRLEINLLEKFHSTSDLVNDFLEHRLKHHNISVNDHFENIDILKGISDIIQIENNSYPDAGGKKNDQIIEELFDYKNIFYSKKMMEIDDALKLKTTNLETCRQGLETCFLQMSRLAASLQEKEGELATLIENNSSIKSEMLHKESKIDSLGREVDILNAENDALKNELIVLYTSKSWKLTRPLRKLRKLFG